MDEIESNNLIKYYQAILETTTEGFVLLDLSGKIILSNKPAENILRRLGGERAQNAEDTYAALESIGFFTASMVKKLMNMRKGQIPEPRKKLFKIEGAEKTYIERFESAILDNDGRPLGWLIGLRDVTHQQEKAIWQYDMTNMIVHDLKNPISTMLMTFQWLESTITSEDGKLLVGNGITVGQHMLDLIDSLLDMAKMEANRLIIEPEPIMADEFIGKIVEDVKPLLAQKEIGVVFDRQNPDLEIWGDRIILRRLIINLIDNAFKFSLDNSLVEIKLQPLEGDLTYTHYVSIEVVDQGPGVPDSDKELIFQRFRQSKSNPNVRSGNGLGLAFCKMGVEAHHGNISVRDNPEGGSIFVIDLPGLPRSFAKELSELELGELKI